MYETGVEGEGAEREIAEGGEGGGNFLFLSFSLYMYFSLFL
jgi:hypothetical protein